MGLLPSPEAYCLVPEPHFLLVSIPHNSRCSALGPGAPRVPFLSAKRDQRITLCRENGHRLNVLSPQAWGPGWLMAKVPLTLVCKTASCWNLMWPHGPSWESMLLDLLELAP